MRFSILLSVALLSLFSNATPWNYDLWLGRGGLWESRCGITVDNPTETKYEGKTISVKVGSNPGEVPLAGVHRASLRVVNNANIQLLYNVWHSDLSAPLQSDTIPEGAVLTLPLVCDAHCSTGFTIYFNNPSAWSLADFLSERPDTPLNGDFELGEEMPLGWYENTMKPYHQLARSTESPASGTHCIKQVAAPGLEPSWSGFYRDGISVTSGSEYTVKVKVRTKDL